jgi:hypothetical protein
MVSGSQNQNGGSLVKVVGSQRTTRAGLLSSSSVATGLTTGALCIHSFHNGVSTVISVTRQHDTLQEITIPIFFHNHTHN